jgi:hypothetical protein
MKSLQLRLQGMLAREFVLAIVSVIAVSAWGQALPKANRPEQNKMSKRLLATFVCSALKLIGAIGFALVISQGSLYAQATSSPQGPAVVQPTMAQKFDALRL